MGEPKEKMAQPFIWRGKDLSAITSMTSTLSDIVSRDDEFEANLFMRAYREVTPEDAEANVGYVLGYLPKDLMVAGLRMFNVKHPIFGDADEAEKVTPTTALELGIRIGGELSRQPDVLGKIAEVREAKEAAIIAGDFETATALRTQEQELMESITRDLP